MYKLIKDTISNQVHIVHRLADNAFIPFDEANVDFQQYQKWLEEGNTPLPAENT